MRQDETSYRVFTRQFDKVVLANDLPSRAPPERAWTQFMDDTLEQRTRWELEASRRASVLREVVAADELKNTLITLLIDQSGSMRGERMLLAAAAVDVARAFLVHLGASVEVLGFTTRSWKGGWSRRIWRWTGKRRSPGRLCDLLHIVYADAADRRPGSGTRSLVHMLDPQLLKENVDGEALLWAADRQDQHSRKHKVIVLISDGAPVDDSTLHENGPTYLMDHLQHVVVRLGPTRTLAQLQIGDECESHFELIQKIDTLSEVGPALLSLLSDAVREATAPLRASRA
jgi:cobaltochelatase CobT